MDLNDYRVLLRKLGTLCASYACCVCGEGKVMQLKTIRWLVLLCSKVFW